MNAEESPKIHAFCLKCQKQILVRNPKHLETTNQRLRVAGECPECSKAVSQFQKSKKEEKKEAEPEKKEEAETPKTA